MEILVSMCLYCGKIVKRNTQKGKWESVTEADTWCEENDFCNLHESLTQ